MNAPILSSTLLLTLLLMVGLFFFIRASVKDRTEQITLLTSEPAEILLEQLQKYFEKRAYRITDIDTTKNQVTFQGFVKPSLFLAIFLTTLAALGLFCLALVLALLYPAAGNFVWLLLFLAPTAGIFYWRKAGRLEQVLLKVANSTPEQNHQKFLTVTAHRDELTQLRRALPLQVVE
ncbi:cofactor assembly of complex C subunit B [Pleurocapsales cyanobacterium LEGE 06147]|nr:cofactor assembly of complex C subunit B [Pleurocapsales cyanobacterium LEGE 06147]